jgi:hypothetical protein
VNKDFAAFDAKLLQLIDSGFNTLSLLEYAPGLRPLATALCRKQSEEFRVIDRRLQAARRAGKIRYNGKHWERREQ